jgi:hypothetical protein
MNLKTGRQSLIVVTTFALNALRNGPKSKIVVLTVKEISTQSKRRLFPRKIQTKGNLMF